MGNEYRTEKKILASELFDGRLKKFDIQEHDRGHSAEIIVALAMEKNGSEC
jgi:hypothetical protein